MLRPSNDVEWWEGQGGGGTGKQKGKEESIWERGGGVLFEGTMGGLLKNELLIDKIYVLKKTCTQDLIIFMHACSN